MPVALIGPDLLRKLPAKTVDYRDQKLTGFALRCRASGAHSYIVSVARGRWQTIGRATGKDALAPEVARATAATLLQSVERDALRRMGDDATINLRTARAGARRDLHAKTGAGRLTWRTFLEEHYAPWVVEHHKTRDEAVIRLRLHFSGFNDLRLTEISTHAIERWRRDRMKAGTAPATINRDLSDLRGALSRALDWKLGGLKVHPMRGLKFAKLDPHRRLRYMSDEEEARLFAALDARETRRRRERETANAWRAEREYEVLPAFDAEGFTDYLKPLIVLALHTGARRGELFQLRWRDVHLERAQMMLRGESTKTGYSRAIDLNTTALDTLRRWRPGPVPLDGLVFPAANGGVLDNIQTSWERLLKAANITDLRFHDLRHCFASKLVQAGVDLNTTRELLGHRSIAMTLRYSHLTPGHRAAAVAKLVGA